MNTRALIDLVVGQTTILIAQLATTAGLRAPVAHLANQVFLDLVSALEAQGLGRKVIADMFGLALRSYQQKVRRLSESSTDQGRSLWEAVFDYLNEREVASRADVLRRFRRDDEASVRGILNDLVETGLVYRTGRGPSTVYRITPEDDLDRAVDPETVRRNVESLVWIHVYRMGPITVQELQERLHFDAEQIDEALSALRDEGRVRPTESGDAFVCDQVLVGLGDAAGWEAAVFDHFQAMVTALCVKLRQGATSSGHSDRIGGTTLSFDVWDGHPYEERVYGLLQQVRDDLIPLWDEVAEYNADKRARAERGSKVTFYFGQTVQSGEAEDAD